MVRRSLVCAAFASLSIIGVWAQTSEHQRIGVERKTVWEASVEAGSSFYDNVFQATDSFGADCYVALDVLLDKTWSCGVSVPATMEWMVGNSVRYPFGFGLGDVSLSGGWTGRVRDTRLGLAASITVPTGTRAAIPSGPLAIGSGRWSAGLNASASVILDPVVVGVGLSYDLGFPRRERFGCAWEPGSVGFGLSVTEILNDSIGYSIRLSQNFSLPTVYAGVAEPDGVSYSTRASFELFYSKNDQVIRVGFSKGLSADAGPGIVSLSYSYSLRSREKAASGSQE